MSKNGGAPESFIKAHQYTIVFRDPNSILKKSLGDNLTIVDFESQPFFSKFGNNYGSTMMKISVSLQRKGELQVENLYLVGKLLPPTDYHRQLFESDYTFKKEIFFYEQLIPTYQEIYKGKLNIVPQYYGSRLSLNSGTDIMDEDAVLLLENLKVKGYYMEDRQKGLDLDHLSIIVPAIAKFHAIGRALKHAKPTFLPVLKKYTRRIAGMDIENKKALKKLMKDIENNSQVNQYYIPIKALYDQSEYVDNSGEKSLEAGDPWASVVHFDLWNNNMLFHRNEENKVDDVKIVDFQTYTIGSPLTDLVFLLCTSMKYPMEHIDAMLELYRETACTVLEELNLDAGLFTKENFEKRLKIDAMAEIFHMIIMTNVVEYREGDDFVTGPPNEFTIRRWKRVFEIFERKKWF